MCAILASAFEMFASSLKLIFFFEALACIKDRQSTSIQQQHPVHLWQISTNASKHKMPRRIMPFNEALEELDRAFNAIRPRSTTRPAFKALAQDLLHFFVARDKLQDMSMNSYTNLDEIHTHAERAAKAFLAMYGQRVWNRSDASIAQDTNIQQHTKGYFIYLLQTMPMVEGKVSDKEFKDEDGNDKKSNPVFNSADLSSLDEKIAKLIERLSIGRQGNAQREDEKRNLRRLRALSAPGELKSYRPRTYPCPMCDQVFASGIDANDHAERDHEWEEQ